MVSPILTEVLWYVQTFFIYFSWWVIPIGFLIVAKVKWSRFPIEAIILEMRGDNIIKTNDRIGKNFSKGTGHTTYLIQKMGDVIDVLPFECILHSNYKATNFLEYIINKIRPTIGSVHLLKYGSKQYKPVKIVRDKETHVTGFQTIKDINGQDIVVNRVLPFDIRNHLGVIDFQVIDWDDVNTCLNEIENSRLRRIAKWDTWAKFLLPLAIIAMAVILSIIVIYLTYDAQLQFCNAPQIIQLNSTVPGQMTAQTQTMNIPVISQMAG